jgi:hypothetical protein
MSKEPMPNANDSPLMPFDYLARVRFSGVPLENIDIAVHPTEIVMRSFRDFLEEMKERNSILVEVIKKQKTLTDYNGFYNSLLLNQISEHDFKKIAEGFAFSPATCDESEVEKKTLVLLHNTGISFSAADLSYFWGCPEEQIEAVLTKLEKEKSIE